MNIHRQNVFEGMKNLQITEKALLTEIIKQDLEIPINQSGRFLINRKMIASIDSWDREIKTLSFNKRLSQFNKSGIKKQQTWAQISELCLDFAFLLTPPEKILDAQIVSYTTQNLERVLDHVGVQLKMNEQWQKRQIGNQLNQMERAKNVILEDGDFLQLSKKYNLINPHKVMAKSLTYLLKLKE